MFLNLNTDGSNQVNNDLYLEEKQTSLLTVDIYDLSLIGGLLSRVVRSGLVTS